MQRHSDDLCQSHMLFLNVEDRSSQNGPVRNDFFAFEPKINVLLFSSSSAMTTNTKREELEPRSRVRSSSATESSKPNNAVNRARQGTSGVQRTHIFSQGKRKSSIDSKYLYFFDKLVNIFCNINIKYTLYIFFLESIRNPFSFLLRYYFFFNLIGPACSAAQ